MTNVNYEKIYEAIRTNRTRVITASGLAHAIGVDRIYGATMTKLVREGVLECAPAKGYYYIIDREV